jgi:PAS domain S-box-containing protein
VSADKAAGVASARRPQRRPRRSAGSQPRNAVALHVERLRILHEIDRAIIAEQSPQQIAGAVIQPLRALLRVPRAIVNQFDLERGEVEWLAAAGRQRTHVGPGVRYSILLAGDIDALRRGEPQLVDTRLLPPGPEVDALTASGVYTYMVVPMIAGGGLIGSISFGGETAEFSEEQIAIAREVATQLAIAIVQAGLLERVRRDAGRLEQRVAERTAALDALNRELEDLYNHAPCGYHSVDAQGMIVRINDTWLAWLGRSRGEVLGTPHSALMTPDSARRFREEVFPRFLRDGRLEGEDFDYLRKDGSLLHGMLNATILRDAAGNYVTSRSTVYDITERRTARERIQALNAALQSRAQLLEAANKELESFSYSVSHDLRAPLRAVDGYARMLEDDYAQTLDAEGRRLLGVVRAEALRMGRLIDDLLAFSRLGRIAVSDVQVPMAELARECAADLGPAHPAARINIGSLPAARGDRALLRQVWANLLGNALKYSAKAPEPRIEIAGRATNGECCYSVKDNGAGFDMRYYDKLFGVFQRLHDAKEFEGTGVGLAIVQRIVSRHGGRVWAEGKTGEGAVFHFALPEKLTP